MLDYKLLEAMAMVVQAGGFDKAARVLHLTQSAVSQRVRQLEEQTGQILVVRTSPPRATPAGRQLIRHYRQVKHLEGDLRDATSLPSGDEFVSLAVGINADSLATWFPDAILPFLKAEKVLLDLSVDDQEETHRLLKNGEVMGCISAWDQSMQGGSIAYLGFMNYRLVTTPEFAARWFPDGLTTEAVCRAPALIFNRKDRLHNKLFHKALGEIPATIPAHYIPSSGKFPDFILSGFAYGMLPDQQSASLIRSGRLIELVPDCEIPVRLCWHCWNIRSRLLEKFTRNLISRTRDLLER